MFIRTSFLFLLCHKCAMDRWRNTIAIVTGASAGIGTAICKKLAENGIIVVGLARRIELVQELANQITATGGKLFPLRCDISNPEEIKRVFKHIKETYGPVQILINNAAYLKNGLIAEEDPEELRKILDTNLLGATICAKEAIAQIRELNLEGHIVFMNSVMGHNPISTPYPGFNLYPSTKYGTTILCRTLEHEIRYLKAKIKVTSLSPGLVGKTNIFKSANMDSLSSDIVNNLPYLLPEDIADGIAYVLGTPPNVQVAELTLKHFEESF